MATLQSLRHRVDILAVRRDNKYREFRELDALYEEAINALWAAEEEATDDV